MNSAFPSPLDALWSAPREWDDDLVVALSFVGWLVTLLVAIALVVGLVLFFATSGFWSGGGDPPSYALTSCNRDRPHAPGVPSGCRPHPHSAAQHELRASRAPLPGSAPRSGEALLLSELVGTLIAHADELGDLDDAGRWPSASHPFSLADRLQQHRTC
jgi:hypothetical protein